MKSNKILSLVVMSALLMTPISGYAGPFDFLKDACLDLVNSIVSVTKKEVVVHPSYTKLVEDLAQKQLSESRFFSLPELEQTLEEFKNTKVPYIKYFYNSRAKDSQGMKEFLENSFEIIYTPHSSRFGHVRLRIGEKLYGFENIMRTAMRDFDPTILYKEVRAIKNVIGRGEGKKAGNLGVAFALTPEDKAILKERKKDIELFYSSSEKYNIPPFDGAGAKEVKLIVNPDNGEMSYQSPTPKSNLGNFAKVEGQIVVKDGKEFLVSPSGFEHPISLNAKGERVVEAYSCSSSVHYVISKILGKKIMDKPYAESFMTHLKNGAEGNLGPDAVIHYYSSSDI